VRAVAYLEGPLALIKGGGIKFIDKQQLPGWRRLGGPRFRRGGQLLSDSKTGAGCHRRWHVWGLQAVHRGHLAKYAAEEDGKDQGSCVCGAVGAPPPAR
jgi:hypothetical protein